MAKIILQASSFKKIYTIDTVAITSSEYESENKFTLEVKPYEGYIVDARDFFNGHMQEEIVSIAYDNTNQALGRAGAGAGVGCGGCTGDDETDGGCTCVDCTRGGQQCMPNHIVKGGLNPAELAATAERFSMYGDEVVDFSNKVRITVELRKNIALKGKGNVVIFIPTNGIAKTVSDELTFIDETFQTEGVSVIDRLGNITLKDSNITQDLHSNTYITFGSPEETGIIMQKIFFADEGYYLSTPPTWRLNSKLRKNYTITSRELKDENNRLVKKIYEISYSFPKEKFVEEYQDKIIFS